MGFRDCDAEDDHVTNRIQILTTGRLGDLITDTIKPYKLLLLVVVLQVVFLSFSPASCLPPLFKAHKNYRGDVINRLPLPIFLQHAPYYHCDDMLMAWGEAEKSCELSGGSV